MLPFNNIPTDTFIDLCKSGIYYEEYPNVRDAIFAEWMIEMGYW